MQNLFTFWKTVRRDQPAAKRTREDAAEDVTSLPASQKRQKLEDAQSHSRLDASTAMCCLHTLKPRGTPQGLVSGLPQRVTAASGVDHALPSGCAPPKRRLELAALPAELLRIISQQLDTEDRMSLRQTSKVLFDSVSFGGIRLAYPMPLSERQLIPALAKRSGLKKLHFVQTDEKSLRKRDFKTLLSRLGDAPANRRYTVQINVSAAITTSDMQWLEQHFGLRGYMPQIGRVDVRCHVADFQYAFPMAPKLRVQAQQLTKRFSSAIQMGVLKNLESLQITHMREENDVQMAWSIADRAVSPALRCLVLAAARGATIPVGCRRMHPDFSHLERLSISADIFLCINFLCHLLPLRVQGMECCQGLQKVLDEYTAKKQQGRIHLPPGADEANQHGFLVPFAVM